jgi:hypothetical protein
MPYASRVLLLGALAAACADSSPTTPTVPSPQFNFSNGPAAVGPVLRTKDAILFVFTNPEPALTALVALVNPIGEACETDVALVKLVDLQQVLSSGLTHALVQGEELPVTIYEGESPPDEICAELPTAPVIATGTARLTHNFLTFPDGSGRFSQRAQGFVTYSAGGTARFSAVVNIFFNPDGSFASVFAKITLTPARGR